MVKYIYVPIVFILFHGLSYAKYSKTFQKNSIVVKEILYYVSSSVNSFKIEELNGTKEFPFCSLEQARDAIRISRKKSENQNVSYRVILLSGNYQIEHTFSLTDLDSGDSSHPVIYEGEENGEVILNAGIEIPVKNIKKIHENISGYSVIPIKNRNQVYYTNLRDVMSKDLYGKDSLEMNSPDFYNFPVELTINSKLLTLARYPNSGFISTGYVIDSVTFTCNDTHFNNLKYEWNPIISGYLKNDWFFTITKILSLNQETKVIKLNNKPKYGIDKGTSFYFSNMLSELDSAYEYYIDYRSGVLFFIMPENTNIPTSKIEITGMMSSSNNPIIQFNRSNNIIFRNISLINCRSLAINLNNVRNVTLDKLNIKNIGFYGINAYGAFNLKIQNCTISEVGQEGINISGGNRINLIPSNNLIFNCKIERVSRIIRTYKPAIEISGVGNIVKNCSIDSLPHIAILYSGNDNLIENNEIYNVGYETSDAAAIYVGRDWASRGNLIQYNYIHDVISNNKNGYPLNAIYFDDCASGNTAKNNVIKNISGYGVLMGGGRDNIVDENIIFHCGIAAVHIDARGVTSINNKKGDGWNLKEKIENLNYKSEIWRIKYPDLFAIFDKGYDNAKLPFGSKIINNFYWDNKSVLNGRDDIKKYYIICR